MSQTHHHSHDNDETYFIDQLCMVALSAAFGAICLSLYFWQVGMLNRLLGQQFHVFILASGIVLLLLAAVRGAVLWVQVGKTTAHEHGHDHTHEPAPTLVDGTEGTLTSTCAHDTCHDGHDHGHHHHDHGHDHHHHHHHHHDHHHHHEHHHHEHDHHHHSHGDHDASDHEHGWAPWRYVVLMIPVIFFLVGAPSKGPRAQAVTIDLTRDVSKQAKTAATWLALGPPSLEQLALVHVAHRRNTEKASEIDFKTLEGAAAKEGMRNFWTGKRVKVRGQFVPDRRSNKVFSLARFRIQCCGADAVQLNVPILAEVPIEGIHPNDWILVTGEVDFYEVDGVYRTLLRLHLREDLQKTEPDINPYIT